MIIGFCVEHLCGQVYGIDKMRSDSALTEKTIDYSYDMLSRLLQADYDNGATVYNYVHS
jgi:hypothetical protein